MTLYLTQKIGLQQLVILCTCKICIFFFSGLEFGIIFFFITQFVILNARKIHVQVRTFNEKNSQKKIVFFPKRKIKSSEILVEELLTFII
jgi:hypothetical protein